MRIYRCFVRSLVCLLLLVCFPVPARAQETSTVAWMSDTQNYYGPNAATFPAMTQWLLDNKEAFDIRLVLHTGDVVSASRSTAQWSAAQKALAPLQGELPLLALAGNHDAGKPNSYVNFNTYVDPVQSIKPLSGGFFGDGRDRYALLTIGERDYIFIAFSYASKGILDVELQWANDLLARYSERTAILLTHSYLFARAGRTGYGETLYKNVVEPNPNVWLVLCGHCRGANFRTQDIDDNGDGQAERTVYQSLANYQSEPKGGGGYMRLLCFREDSLYVTTYSPVSNDYIHFEAPGADSFTIPYPAE